MPGVLDSTKKSTRSRGTKRDTILVATDASPKAESAVRFAGILAAERNYAVQVSSVLDSPPTLWFGTEPSVDLSDSTMLKDDITVKVLEQLFLSGDSSWSVAVRKGEFTSQITLAARAAHAKLLLVGFRRHGGLARLFGRDTLIQLARVSDTPVLAVSPDLDHLPRRIVVGMDFSSTSINAARIAMELAAEDATIVLAHVVPWDPEEYVPPHWIAAREATLGAELSRVAGWLEKHAHVSIEERVLYGSAGSVLPQFAESCEADLLVVGGHQRGAVQRVLAGQTVAKLIRHAHCSVLIQPPARGKS
jgi:Universal stress protein UspA and related nucleotide-binding proteins